MDSSPAAVAIAFETMLLTPLLRPLLARSEGLGDFGAALLAAGVARADRGEMTRSLTSRLVP